MARAQSVVSGDRAIVSGWAGGGTAMVVYLALLLLLPQQLIVGPLGFAGSPATIWGLVCFLWWVWFHVNRVNAVVGSRAVRWTALLFLAAVLVSYTRAMTHPMAGDEVTVADAGVLRVLSWLGVMLLAADGLEDRQQWWRALEWLVGLCSVVAVLGLVQGLTGQTWVDRIVIPGLTVNAPITLTDAREGHVRPIGTSTHAIEFGQVLTMGLVVSAGMALVRSTGRHRAAVVLCGTTSLLIVSRSAVLSIAVACLVLASALTRRQRIVGASVGLLVVMVAYMLRPGLLGTLGRMFTGIEGDASARSRTDSYDYAFHAFASSPWFGKGPATFLPKYRILDNQWLLSAIEIGIVGVACFALLMAAVVRSGFRAERVLSTRDEQIVTRAAASAVVAVCVGMLFYDGFAFPQATGMLFAVSGLVAGSYRLAHTPTAVLVPRPPPGTTDPDPTPGEAGSAVSSSSGRFSRRRRPARPGRA